MFRKIRLKTICLFLLLIIPAACNYPSTAPTLVSSSTETPPELLSPTATIVPIQTEATSNNGQCANTYYPIREGATWTYSSTGGPAGGHGFTDTITSVREDGFTLTSKFGDLTRTQEWACTPEGLVALQLGGTAASILNEDNMQVTLDVNHVSGVTFPLKINPGDTWQHTLEFTGKVIAAGQAYDATGSAESKFQAVGNESVTVPAGTFDALKIHVDTTIDIQGSFNGISFPVKITTPYDYWFVQGIGWVKASGTGKVSGEAFSETIELQSYHIP